MESVKLDMSIYGAIFTALSISLTIAGYSTMNDMARMAAHWDGIFNGEKIDYFVVWYVFFAITVFFYWHALYELEDSAKPLRLKITVEGD